MSQHEELVPVAVRIALRNAVGGWGPYSVREIVDLFNMHGFTQQDTSIEDAGGERRTAAERFHSRVDWADPEQAQRYLNLVSDVLDRYPEENDEPGSPGRMLRRVLDRGGFVALGGALRLPPAGLQQRPELDAEGIWIPDRPRVFFSHVSSVREEASAVAEALEAMHCSCFLAHAQIEPSQDWQDAIEAALDTTHVLVAWVTPDFPQSRWTDQEVGWVLGRGAHVIPVNAGLEAYGFFGARQSLRPGVRATATAFRIFETLASHSLRPRRLPRSVPPDLAARAVVRSFAVSPNFNATRERFPLLRLIPPHLWTERMLEELQTAATDNRQIREAVLTDVSMDALVAVGELVARVRGHS